MKKALSLILAIAMLIAILPAGLAAEPADPPTPHNWEYTQDGSTVTAKCVADHNCIYHNVANYPQATIKAVNARYTGKAYTGAKVVLNKYWEDAGLDQPNIWYKAVDAKDPYWDPAPKESGDYEAVLLYGTPDILNDHALTITPAKFTIGSAKDPVNIIVDNINGDETGTITLDKDKANPGDIVTVKIDPATGYKIATLNIDGEPYRVENPDVASYVTFEVPDTGNVDIVALFTKSHPIYNVELEANGYDADVNRDYYAAEDGSRIDAVEGQSLKIAVKVSGDKQNAAHFKFAFKTGAVEYIPDSYNGNGTIVNKKDAGSFKEITDAPAGYTVVEILDKNTRPEVDGFSTVAEFDFRVTGADEPAFYVYDANFVEKTAAQTEPSVPAVVIKDKNANDVMVDSYKANAKIVLGMKGSEVNISSDITDPAIDNVPDKILTGDPLDITLDTENDSYDPDSVYAMVITDGEHDVYLFYGDETKDDTDKYINFTVEGEHKKPDKGPGNQWWVIPTNKSGLVDFHVEGGVFEGPIQIKMYKISKYDVNVYNSLTTSEGVDYVPGCTLVTVEKWAKAPETTKNNPLVDDVSYREAGQPKFYTGNVAFYDAGEDADGGVHIIDVGKGFYNYDSAKKNEVKKLGTAGYNSPNKLGTYEIKDNSYKFDGHQMYRINSAAYGTDEATAKGIATLTSSEDLKKGTVGDEFAYVVAGNITKAQATAKVEVDEKRNDQTLSGGVYDLRGGLKLTYNGTDTDKLDKAEKIEIGTPAKVIGDVNGDGKWDVADIRATFNCQNRNTLGYDLTLYMADYLRADINRDHTVDAEDINAIQKCVAPGEDEEPVLYTVSFEVEPTTPFEGGSTLQFPAGTMINLSGMTVTIDGVDYEIANSPSVSEIYLEGAAAGEIHSFPYTLDDYVTVKGRTSR